MGGNTCLLIRSGNRCPKPCQFFRAKIGEDFPINVDHGRIGLVGEVDHFSHGVAVGKDIERLIFDAAFVEPVLCFMAPGTVRFDE